MKTTNKIQKTALTAAVAVGLAILGFSINAQDEINLQLENKGANHFAMVNAKTSNHLFASAFNARNLISNSALTAYLVKETEAPLCVEEWMLDETNFSIATLIETETENELELEEWMIDENNFVINSVNIEAATDEQLNLENWMLDENNFISTENVVSANQPKTIGKIISTNNYVFQNVVSESKLILENWMVNTKIWGK